MPIVFRWEDPERYRTNGRHGLTFAVRFDFTLAETHPSRDLREWLVTPRHARTAKSKTVDHNRAEKLALMEVTLNYPARPMKNHAEKPCSTSVSR